MLPFVPPVKKQVLAIRRYAWPDFFFCRINACSQVYRHGPGAVFLQGAHVKIGAAKTAFFPGGEYDKRFVRRNAGIAGIVGIDGAPFSISTLG